MTVANVHDSAASSATAARRLATDELALRVGDIVAVRVVARQDGNRYLVAIGGRTLVAQSEQRLEIGGEVQTRVEQTGDRLDLKIVMQATSDDATGPTVPVEERFVAGLAAQYHVPLRDGERALIARSALDATSPLAMSLAGLYLRKLGQPLSAAALSALHDVQVLAPDGRHRDRDGVTDVSVLLPTVIRGQAAATEALTATLIDGMPGPGTAATQPMQANTTPQTSSDTGGGDDGSDAERQAAERLLLAIQLLNQQDDGSVGHRYGCLPLLVNGRLVELDVALFQQRAPESAGRGVRRLVLLLRSPVLGEVGVTVQAVDDRLSVGIEAADAAACARLGTSAAGLRDLLSGLGWHVDALSIGVRDAAVSPAGQIVEHTLSLGTINQRL